MEGIIIAHEAIHFIHLACTKRLIVKLDIKKAYDQVNWYFLFKVLDKFIDRLSGSRVVYAIFGFQFW